MVWCSRATWFQLLPKKVEAHVPGNRCRYRPEDVCCVQLPAWPPRPPTSPLNRELQAQCRKVRPAFLLAEQAEHPGAVVNPEEQFRLGRQRGQSHVQFHHKVRQQPLRVHFPLGQFHPRDLLRIRKPIPVGHADRNGNIRQLPPKNELEIGLPMLLHSGMLAELALDLEVQPRELGGEGPAEGNGVQI